MNKHNTHVQFSGYGHYKVFTTYYGNEINAITTNMPLIDAFKSDDEKRRNAAMKKLREFVIYIYKNYKK